MLTIILTALVAFVAVHYTLVAFEVKHSTARIVGIIAAILVLLFQATVNL